ncbi:MAG: hypothetical protein ACFFCS_13605 [Candidatus Hodarchaeota archaeon]
MNVFVLKGVLVDANRCSGGDSGFKERIFEAISYPGFIHNTYDVIGVEFGLGLIELPEATQDEEDALVKIQVWNLNERKNFVLNWRSFLKGSRFGLITWNQEEKSFPSLMEILADCTSKVPNMSLGLVFKQNKDDSPRDLIEIIEKKAGIDCKLVPDIEELIISLILSSVKGERHAFVLPISSINEIQHVEMIESPFTSYLTRASEELVNLLESKGFDIDSNNYLIIEKEDFILKLDLNKLQLYACNKECALSRCKKYPCPAAFKRICVVLESTKRGWVSDDIGLLKSDLFFLSIIYSIMNDALPKSITSQFPRLKPCK